MALHAAAVAAAAPPAAAVPAVAASGQGRGVVCGCSFVRVAGAYWRVVCFTDGLCRFVVYVDPKCAAKATEASGQLEGGGRPLRLRLYYDKIPFDRPAGEKRVKCSDVIATEPHADCWFCLANPQVEKHMIVDIADRLYSAVPKGGLTSLHMLLIPIAHLPSLAYADADTRREAAELVAAARKAFHKQVRVHSCTNTQPTVQHKELKEV